MRSVVNKLRMSANRNGAMGASVFQLFRGDYEVFRPAGAIRCTGWIDIWREDSSTTLENAENLAQNAPPKFQPT